MRRDRDAMDCPLRARTDAIASTRSFDKSDAGFMSLTRYCGTSRLRRKHQNSTTG